MTPRFKFRQMKLSRTSGSWEVASHKVVQPVRYYPNDDDHQDLIRVSETNMRGTYVFDMTDDPQYDQRALVFARQQLVKEISKRGYNALLLEGWQVTIMRKGADRRMEIEYCARPALMSRAMSTRLPPFFELLTNKLY